MLKQKLKHKEQVRAKRPNCKFKSPCDFKTTYGGKTKCRWDGKCNQQVGAR